MKIKSGAMELYEQYSQFESNKEFNYHVKKWLADYQEEFTKAELVGLTQLVQVSQKSPGVCHAKIDTMLSVILDENHGHGISRSTFKRMIQTAVKLGMLVVHETVKGVGFQSSNLYVFQRYPTIEPPKNKKLNQQKENKKILKINDNKKRNDVNVNKIHSVLIQNSEPPVDHSFTNDRVPTDFIRVVKCFFPESKIIEEFWHMATVAANHLGRQAVDSLDTIIASFKQLISKMKKIQVRNPLAYFFGILEKKMREFEFEEMYEMGVSIENFPLFETTLVPWSVIEQQCLASLQ